MVHCLLSDMSTAIGPNTDVATTISLSTTPKSHRKTIARYHGFASVKSFRSTGHNIVSKRCDDQ